MKARKTRILADLPAHLLSRPRTWIAVGVTGLSLMGVVAATAVAPDTAPADILFERVVQTLPTPVASIASAEAELPFVYNERIQAGDTLQAIFNRLRIDDAEALAHLSASDAGRKALRQLRAGRSVTAVVSPQGRLLSFSLPVGNTDAEVVLERDDAGLVAHEAQLVLRDRDGRAVRDQGGGLLCGDDRRLTHRWTPSSAGGDAVSRLVGGAVQA